MRGYRAKVILSGTLSWGLFEAWVEREPDCGHDVFGL